jgi:hypothetical protein
MIERLEQRLDDTETDREQDSSRQAENSVREAQTTKTEKAAKTPNTGQDRSAERRMWSTPTRRGALTGLGLLALLGGTAGTASADAQGQVGTSSDPLTKLYTQELNGGVTGNTALTSVAGDGLTITSNTLTAAVGNGLEFDSGNTRVNPNDIAGTGLTEESATSLGIAANGVTGTEIDLSTIAGTNLSVNGSKLDASGGGGSYSGVSVYLTSSKTWNNGDQKIVGFDTEQFDTDSAFDTGTHKYTAPSAGYYHVSAQVLFDTFYEMYLIHDTGSTATIDIANQGNALKDNEISKTVNLSSGDKLWLEVKRTSSGGQSTITTGRGNAYLTIDKVG